MLGLVASTSCSSIAWIVSSARFVDWHRFWKSSTTRLHEELADRSIVAPTIKDIGAVLTSIDDAMDSGTLSQRKALMQQLVSEIRVDSRSAIFPTCRLPAPPVRVYIRSGGP